MVMAQSTPLVILGKNVDLHKVRIPVFEYFQCSTC